jgi:hypothetical protein
VSLLVGGVAIHAGARVVSHARGYGHAVLTALVGAVVRALLDPVPLIGGLLATAAWIGVVRWRYRGGWLRSIGVGIAAWVVAVAVLAALDLLGVGAMSAPGIPGT